jgi:hypothetical protein
MLMYQAYACDFQSHVRAEMRDFPQLTGRARSKHVEGCFKYLMRGWGRGQEVGMPCGGRQPIRGSLQLVPGP